MNDDEDEQVSDADWVPAFWNYLNDLDSDDLIAELVQNDLDQKAKRTVISFEENQLVCEGDGSAVDADGWGRLKKMYGAGDKAIAKRRKIGVKNHGLNTAFTIGYEIRLMSAGRKITKKLYKNGLNKPPYPSASKRPLPDPNAPSKGCRIIVPYRYDAIIPTKGEGIEIEGTSEKELGALFRSMCASAPEQFAGIVSPETTSRYELVLRHWQLGEAHFTFSCTKPEKSKGIEFFRRRCVSKKIKGDDLSLPEDSREQVARRLAPLSGRLKERVADFYRHGNRYFVEVSWPIDRRGKPKKGSRGRYRYPIGYPHYSPETRTGHGVYFNAPFVSDSKRDHPSRKEKTHGELLKNCEALLVDALAHHVIPKWKADGLAPLTPVDDDAKDAIRPLLAELALRDAIPTLKWIDAAKRVAKRKKIKIPVATLRPTAQVTESHPIRKYSFILPMVGWEPCEVDPWLSILSPRTELQIDPRINPSILGLLADTESPVPGFEERFITFDEDDALSRAKGEGNDWFDGPPRSELDAIPVFIARAYLDLIMDSLEENELDENDKEALQNSLLLPDTDGKTTPLAELRISAPIPSDIPGVKIPPILHADLSTHPLVSKRKGWKRTKYTMGEFLECDEFHNADEPIRRRFWEWLRKPKNARRIDDKDRPKLASLAIWPDENDQLRLIEELCEPSTDKIAAILIGNIYRPHKQVRRLPPKLVSFDSKSKKRTSIRRKPNKEEIESWFNNQLSMFENEMFLDETMPAAGTLQALKRFEGDLVVLLKDKSINKHLHEVAEDMLPALARDGTIRWRTELVMPDGEDQFALPGQFLLKDEQYSDTLDKLAPTLAEPTASMLLEAFKKDPRNFDTLHTRLKRFVDITQPESEERRQLADMPIIPVEGQPQPPSHLAFVGSKGDYWGKWKIRIHGNGLSQNDQDRYRKVGVMHSVPVDHETSRAFFEWLSNQGQAEIQQHLPCVLRHILHLHGPTSWAPTYTDIRVIPVENQDGVSLVSLQTARQGRVYLRDAMLIADSIIAADPSVLLVVHRYKGVTDPITEQIRNLNIKSLRETLKEPSSVSGIGSVTPAKREDLAMLKEWKSSKFGKTFKKRVSELGVELKFLRHNWRERLLRVKEIRFADEVEARYQFYRRFYPIRVDGGFDPSTGIFWMKRDHGNYEPIAAQLVFERSAWPIHHSALERAVNVKIKDLSFDFASEDASDLDDDTPPENEIDDAVPGEAGPGHSPFEPDPSRNIPKPTPIPTRASSSKRSSTSRKSGGSSGKKNNGTSPAPEIEAEHIERLKGKQYASHCQMCLCKKTPRKLAPPGSYVEWEEVRRGVVEAHHADLKSAGGARHAGNLILLCKFHHDNYGRRLTRMAVTDALRKRKVPKIIRFDSKKDKSGDVAGRVIKVAISDSDEPVEMFFTDYHAEFWLSHAD